MPTIQKMALSKLIPASYNPRTISPRAMSGLKASVKRWGLVQPVIWNKKTGNVVGGHQRLKVLQEQGVKNTEVVVVDMPEDEEKALNLSLNNSEIQGDWTEAALGIVSDIEMKTPDLADETALSELRKMLSQEDFNPDEIKEDAIKPAEEIIPAMELKPFEHYDYILIVSQNIQDWNYLCDRLGIEKVDASQPGIERKSGRKIGLGRALWASKLIAALKADEGKK